MFVLGDAFQNGERAYERVVSTVQTARGPFERLSKTHETPGANAAVGVASLVEFDDETTQRFLNGHCRYKQRECLNSQS